MTSAGGAQARFAPLSPLPVRSDSAISSASTTVAGASVATAGAASASASRPPRLFVSTPPTSKPLALEVDILAKSSARYSLEAEYLDLVARTVVLTPEAKATTFDTWASDADVRTLLLPFGELVRLRFEHTRCIAVFADASQAKAVASSPGLPLAGVPILATPLAERKRNHVTLEDFEDWFTSSCTLRRHYSCDAAFELLRRKRHQWPHTKGEAPLLKVLRPKRAREAEAGLALACADGPPIDEMTPADCVRAFEAAGASSP